MTNKHFTTLTLTIMLLATTMCNFLNALITNTITDEEIIAFIISIGSILGISAHTRNTIEKKGDEIIKINKYY